MRLRACLIAVLLAGLATGPAFAQVVTTGSIQVKVVDADGRPLPGVTVTAWSDDTVTRRTVFTDEQGQAGLGLLAPSRQYRIEAQLQGFTTVRREEILVRSGQVTSLEVQMSLSAIQEVITVTASTPVVDTTSATIGQDITLRLTESLPTGRSYQSYLQLVPGVLPDDSVDSGNPASKSGLNYRDIFGDNGVSRDNFYYVDGINITDGVTGTFGANLNTEIIQEQTVITGGIPAEYIGAAGLISSVITKTGTNSFHGSGNYFFQNDALVGQNENAADEEFSTFDTAFTLGGPIVRDRAWFFGSYRRLERDDDVVSLDTLQLLRSVNNTQNQSYLRGTVSPTGNDTLAFTFLNDPTDISGRKDRDIVNNRDRSREQGGNNYSLTYSSLFARNYIIDLAYNRHNGEVSDFATVRDARNDIVFRQTDDRTLEDEQLGGFGNDIVDQRDTELYKAAFQAHADRHEIKAGFEFAENRNFRNRLTVEDATYTSLASHLSGITAGELATGSFTNRRFNPLNTSDFNGFIRAVDQSARRAEFYGAFDADGDGTITPAELAAGLTFSSAAGNPDGGINYDRTFQSADGPQDTSSQGLSFYVQDGISITDRLYVNLGVRTEQYEHFATTGESIYTFDWTWAPRVSAIYDLFGDGKHKVSAYYGKYYDPIRNNMTNFAGTLSGSVREEQVFVLGEWVTYRVRGGPQFADALFAPTTKTPWTDDLQVGYQVDLDRGMSFEAIYSNRRTRDILEDYDLALYAFRDDGTTNYPGPVDHPDSLFLGLDYFGYDSFPESNFVIATLAGGERDYQGLEFTLRKRYSDRWQGLASYTWNDYEGNTNSDSNADFQGDVLFLDPRAPNQFGEQPGSITHVFKLAGSYDFPFGLQLGGTYRWNSGTIASRTFRASSRNLPVFVTEPFEFAGIVDNWLAPDAVGSLENPSFGILDLRTQYVRDLGQYLRGEFFVDIFNVFDNQDATRLQDLVAGSGGVAFGEGIRFTSPRRFFLGARLNF